MIATETDSVIWVRRENAAFPRQVKTEGCRNIDDLMDAVKNKLEMSAHPDQIALYPSTDLAEYPRDKAVADFFQTPGGPGLSYTNPLIVRVVGKPLFHNVVHHSK